MADLTSHTDSPSPRTARAFGLLLVLAAAIWGLATVVIKDTVGGFPPLWLVGIRFLSAGAIFCVLFAPRLARLAREGRLGDHLRASLVLGVLIGAAYLMNTGALTATTAARSSFLTGTYCVLVPFQAWLVMRRRPTAFNVGAGLLCLAGIALVSLPGGEGGLAFGAGEALTLASAVFLGFHVTATSRLAGGRDMPVLTALQFVVCGLLGVALGALCEQTPTVEALADPAVLGNLAYLVLFATCLALLLQNLGLARVSPSTGALLLSLESVFGVLFSVLLLGEALTGPMVAGFALIFAAVLVSEWLPGALAAAHGRRRGARDGAGADAAGSADGGAAAGEARGTVPRGGVRGAVPLGEAATGGAAACGSPIAEGDGGASEAAAALARALDADALAGEC